MRQGLNTGGSELKISGAGHKVAAEGLGLGVTDLRIGV